MRALDSLPTWPSAHQRRSLCGQSTVTWSAAWRWLTACRKLWTIFTSMAAPTQTLLSQKTVGGQMCCAEYFCLMRVHLKRPTNHYYSQYYFIRVETALVSLLLLHSSLCIRQVFPLTLGSLNVPSWLCSVLINEQWHFVVRMSAQPPCVTSTWGTEPI